MTIKLRSGNTRMRPSTCACVVRYDWREVIPGGQPVISNPVFEKVCTLHNEAGITAEERFQAVLETARGS